MAKFWDKVEKSIPKEIDDKEKHLYHVAIVEGKFNPNTLETTFKAWIQMFNGRSWTKVKDRLKQVGYTKVYLIHDPTVKGEETKEPTKKKAKTGVKTGGLSEAQEKRNALIAKAKELGWTGALNGANKLYEEFIANAEENGEDNGGDGGE